MTRHRQPRTAIVSGTKSIPAPIPSGRAIKRLLTLIGPAIYAVRMHDGVIKIGWTGNLGDRLHGLGTTDLLGIIPGATREDEADLHHELAGHALRGREWYPADDPVVLEVVNRMRDSIGVGALR